jgi:hypothetical protein
MNDFDVVTGPAPRTLPGRPVPPPPKPPPPLTAEDRQPIKRGADSGKVHNETARQ